MGFKLTFAAAAITIFLVGCGEQASSKDFIDAPTAPAGMDEKASMKARGLTDEQIAASKAGQAGINPASGNNPR